MKKKLFITLVFFLLLFLICCKKDEQKKEILYEEKLLIELSDEEIIKKDQIRDDVVSIMIDKNLSNPNEMCSNELIESLIATIKWKSYKDVSYYYFTSDFTDFKPDRAVDFRYNFYVFIEDPGKDNLVKTIRALEKVDGIYNVSYVGIAYAHVLPNDPL